MLFECNSHFMLHLVGLLKDFGWMTTNIFLGFPFGVISVLLHAFLLVFDPRKSFRFYNLSLLIWVTGNFIWMTTEFVATKPSSEIHMGPAVPLGGLSEETINNMVNAKTILFLISSIIQLSMYILVYFRAVPMPEDDEEDVVSKNEAILFFYGAQSYDKQADHSYADNSDDINITMGEAPPSYGFTLIYIENMYIFFWVAKDLFWSWGTGDLSNSKDLAILFESAAMCCGTASIFIYLLTSYLYRRNTLRLLDCITTVLWISANFVWMCGEFFVRYDNLQYDDSNEGDDYSTRVASAALFCLGITVQAFIMVSVGIQVARMSSLRNVSSKSGDTSPRGSHSSGRVEMMNMSNLMVSFTMNPQHSHLNSNGSERSPVHHGGKAISGAGSQILMEDDEESTVLF